MELSVSFSIIKYFFYQIMACLHHNKQKSPQIWHWAIYSREDFWLDVFCKFPGSSTNKAKRHHIHVHLRIWNVFESGIKYSKFNSIQFRYNCFKVSTLDWNFLSILFVVKKLIPQFQLSFCCVSYRDLIPLNVFKEILYAEMQK